MSDTLEKAKAVMGKVAGVPVEELDGNAELVADLGIDSAKSLQLLVELEEATGVEVSDEEAAGMETVQDVLSFFDGK